MGLLDTLLGRTKPVRANLDALFALPSAAVTLQTSAGLVPTGKAGMCWKPPAGQTVADVQQEIAELLDIPDDPIDDAEQLSAAARAKPTGGPDAELAPERPGPEGPGQRLPGAPEAPVPSDRAPTASTGPVPALTQTEDAYGYRWLLLDDPALEDLVTRVHIVNTTLTETGWGPQLLCSVFRFVPGPDADTSAKALFLVYLYKRGTFYPFAPDGKEHRDTEFELRIRGRARERPAGRERPDPLVPALGPAGPLTAGPGRSSPGVHLHVAGAGRYSGRPDGKPADTERRAGCGGGERDATHRPRRGGELP